MAFKNPVVPGIYFIQPMARSGGTYHVTHDFVKIGRSIGIARRLQELQNQNGPPLRLMAIDPVDPPPPEVPIDLKTLLTRVEDGYHCEFDAYHRHAEWFVAAQPIYDEMLWLQTRGDIFFDHGLLPVARQYEAWWLETHPHILQDNL